MFGAIRKLLGRSSPSAVELSSSPEHFVYVKIPGDIQPMERINHFEAALKVALKRSKLGQITGGGSQMDSPYPDGRPRVEFCGIDIDTMHRDDVLRLLAVELCNIGIPPGTELHYTKDGTKLLDQYSGESWTVGIPRTFLHPGFEI